MSAAALRQPIDSGRVLLPHGAVHVIPDRCKGCRFCIELCPEHVLEESAQINSRGYRYPVVAPGKDDACVKCGFCTLICPEMAIYTLEVPTA